MPHTEALLDEIRYSAGPSCFYARGHYQSGSTAHELHLEVDSINQRWFAFDVASQQVLVEFVDGESRIDGRSLGDKYPGLVPDPLTLAFPERLLIWGRSSDDFFSIGAEEFGDHSLLATIQHRDDAAVRGTVVFDRITSLITKIVKPTDVSLLRRIELNRPFIRSDLASSDGAAFEPPSY